jgi:hypothetical protein
MSILVDLTYMVATTTGLEHKIHLQTLRNYIKATPTREILGAIRNISRQDMLRALWEAGLNMELQQAVMRRLEELAQRRT